MERKFFVCSVGQPGKGYDFENLQRIVKEQAFILHEDTKQKGTYDKIRPNDVLILKYQNKLIAYGLATGNHKAEVEEWNLYSSVQEWVFHIDSNHESGISGYGLQSDTIGGGQYGTVKEVNSKFGIDKMGQINSVSQLFKQIKIEEMEDQKSKDLEESISLLRYKKQIILQGPPGTGKTWLAKKIADELTAAKDLGSPLQKVDSFFRTFDPNNAEVIATREKAEGLLERFRQEFPKEELSKLSLRNYCIGTGENDSFCWWIERGLKPLGYYFPGSSRSYLIYWSQKEDTYQTYFKSLKAFKDVKSPEDGMEIISTLLSELVSQAENANFDEMPFGSGFMLKILNSYYPEKFYPANGPNYLTNTLNLLGIESKGKSTIEKNLLMQDFFKKKNGEFGGKMKNYEFMAWLDTEFDLKSPIELTKETLISKGESKLIQFHPSYTYEDFVRGIVVETNEDGQTEYRVVNKLLADFAQKALDNKSSNYVLIIDEINRANLPSVLGELIYALEYRFDPENPAATSVESMYALKEEEGLETAESRVLRLPKNLYLIGTMNTADRSVGHIDYAIRRRFAFVDVLPTKEPITNANAQTLFEMVSKLFVSNYHEIVSAGEVPRQAESLMADFRPEEVWIGHSYFLNSKDSKGEEAEIKMKMKYEVLPLLKEYVKDGILKSDEKSSGDAVQVVIRTLEGL